MISLNSFNINSISTQGRAKQLYNAGYKKIEDVARAKPKEMVANIEHMNFRLAHQLVSAAKVLSTDRLPKTCQLICVMF